MRGLLHTASSKQPEEMFQVMLHMIIDGIKPGHSLYEITHRFMKSCRDRLQINLKKIHKGLFEAPSWIRNTVSAVS